MRDRALLRMGTAAITAGSAFFFGQGGELVLGDDTKVVLAVLVAFFAVAVASFGVAFLAMRQVLGASRVGRIGATVGVAGVVLLVAFAIQLGVAAARTGEVPENFALFALGFLLVLVAHFVVARPLSAVLPRAGLLSVAAGVALLVALAAGEIFLWHDLALFVFEGCWVAIGVLALRRASWSTDDGAVGLGDEAGLHRVDDGVAQGDR